MEVTPLYIIFVDKSIAENYENPDYRNYNQGICLPRTQHGRAKTDGICSRSNIPKLCSVLEFPRTNQENVAYPSGLCAERTALFYANSQYPDVPVKALAIVARDADGVAKRNIIAPCGACRQVMVETEKRFGRPMKVLLCGAEEVYVAESASSLLPLTFDF